MIDNDDKDCDGVGASRTDKENNHEDDDKWWRNSEYSDDTLDRNGKIRDNNDCENKVEIMIMVNNNNNNWLS